MSAGETSMRHVIPAFRWLRANLFSSWSNALATVLIAYLIWKLLPAFFEWAIAGAIWIDPGAAACREVAGHGACWAFVAEKYRFILFGTFPYGQHWRPAVAIAALIALYALSAIAPLQKRQLILLWLGGFALVALLMWGGAFGLESVENERWGGLVLTLLVSTLGLVFAFPLAILVALGRRSYLPLLRFLCVAYIELVRGVPLISLLFMSSVMLPLFLPKEVSIDKLLRAQIAMILFAAAYLAEAVRGGLQALPRGQEEAAQALGLSYWQRMASVVLPQALRIAIPALVNTFIGFFKDTSLLVIIGIFDFLTTVKVSLTEPAWSGFGVEGYLFASVVYFLFCFPMSRYSQRLERRLARAGAAAVFREN